MRSIIFVLALSLTSIMSKCTKKSEAATPSSDDTKTAATRIVNEVIGNGNTAAADSLVASDVKNQNWADTAQGINSFKNYVASLHKAFPDMKLVIDQPIISEDNMVAIHASVNGTQKGWFMGVKPTNKTVVTNLTCMMKFENGKVTEQWNTLDMSQLVDRSKDGVTMASASTRSGRHHRR